MEFSGPILFWEGPIRVPWGGPEILGGSHHGHMGGSHRGSHVKIPKVGGVQCYNPESWGGPDPPNPCGGCAYEAHPHVVSCTQSLLSVIVGQFLQY